MADVDWEAATRYANNLAGLLPGTVVNTIRKQPYPAIDPSKPSLSAAGKNVLITGGATGIGFAIARSFAIAGAATVVLVARRANVLEEAAKKLSAEFPKTTFLYYSASLTDSEAITKLFRAARQIVPRNDIDILVTNAANFSSSGGAFTLPVEVYRNAFETNVIGNIYLGREFMESAPASSKDTEKILLDVSSTGAYVHYSTTQAYGVTKFAFSRVAMQAAQDYPNLRVHSFHPGAIFTDSVKGFGLSEDSVDFDDVNLPGQFAVWLASEEGRFLRNRFVLANWDVNELKSLHDELDNDKGKLVLGMRM
ncbi:NAD(P)-binding protein [Rhizodiscina lignyota]|uniref:NAD(P)-binding protein n=1 Tax=Rhizodiscina lignyota TaxID=1504668 RepID=A0A9P4IA26_9PEZI|nr:NAD(P)-binding protein [Rhizodiscina lignyota]